MARDGSNDLEQEVLRLVPLIVSEGGTITDAFALRHKLHRTDTDALIALMASDAEGRVMTTGALGAALALTSGATTFAVNRLERAGLVQRNRDPNDQRRILLALSEAGRELAGRFYSPVREWSLAVLDRFTDPELEIVRRFLAATADAMSDCRTAFEVPEHVP